MKIKLTIPVLFFLTIGYAQKKSDGRLSKFNAFLPASIESNEGSIILNDGKELVGLLAYNDKTGILKFERGNDSRSLTARTVLGFEIYDPGFDGNRIFYSLQGEDPETGGARPFFFELLKDFKSFAVLSRKEPLTLKEKKGVGALQNPNPNNTYYQSNNVFSGTKNKIVVQQIETFYFLKPQENPQPYFSIIVETNTGKSKLFDGQKTKEKFVDKDLFEEFVGDLFNQVDAYSKENHLSYKEKSDFLKILEYYETLID